MAKEIVSGVGANSSRTDKNLTARTQKVMKSARIENASGGAYGQRAELENLAGGAALLPNNQAMQQSNFTASLPDSNAFAPSMHQDPLSHGGQFGPGQDASQQLTPVDAIDQGSILVRAMFAMNPTPQLRRILEAYNEEGR